jgi:hypothetical protein
MSKGVLTFASNNGEFDYLLQAQDVAIRAKRHLELPTAVVTDTESVKNTSCDLTVFDNVIYTDVETFGKSNSRDVHDGDYGHKTIHWKNEARPAVYELTPYDETLLLDTDIVICNSDWTICFEQPQDFRIYKNCINLSENFWPYQYEKVSETGPDFFWASAIFFRKTKANKIFFDLVQHVKDEWLHYTHVYSLPSRKYRSDYAFSIAIHVMNGFQKGNFQTEMPGQLYYITDKSILKEIKNDDMLLLINDPVYSRKFTACKTKKQTVHVMNKFSLERCLND